MQLQLIESSGSYALKVEDGTVMLDGQPIARMENLPFAGLNEDFQKMSARLTELPIKIEKARAKTEKYPDDKDFQDEKQALLDEYNKLKEDFAEYQNNLFATAKRIAQLQGEQITDRMRRAMEAFNEGRVREANIILEEAERDAENAFQEYKQSKELTEQKRQNVIKSIDEILLKASTTMADLSIPIDERIAKTEELYAKADNMAQECDYEGEKHMKLLFDYGEFLYKFAKYDKAEEVYYIFIELFEELYGTDSPFTAASYDRIGTVYSGKGDYDKALEYHLKALAIREQNLSMENSDIIESYNNLGTAYDDKGDYNKALEYHLKALAISEKSIGLEHPDTASSYNNIGIVYADKGDYDKALEYHLKALAIFEKSIGLEHPDTAAPYKNIGNVYINRSDYNKALEYYLKALAIEEKALGLEHPDTAKSYGNICLVYATKGDYDKALEYSFKTLTFLEKVSGLEHPNTAMAYLGIGNIFCQKGDYNKALVFHQKALAIFEQAFDDTHPYVVQYRKDIEIVKSAMQQGVQSETKEQPNKGIWGRIKKMLNIN